MRMMTVATILLLCASTPADEVRAAAIDLAGLPAVERPTTRYVTLYNVPATDREATAAAVSYLLNAVSRGPTIVRPAVAAESNLLRFDLRWYGLSAELWESLVSQGEPYFHITTNVVADAGEARNRKRLLNTPIASERQTAVTESPASTVRVPAAPVADSLAVSRVYTDGGWIDLELAATVRSLTGSGGALVRADWFVSRVSVPPFYYRLAGVAETRDGWYADLGIDRDKVVELRANHGANVLRSGVTRHVRRVSRWQGPLGGVWQTYDVSASGPGKDPFRDPTFDGRGFQYEASELIAAKANGLHVFALFDAQGRRQDAVPDKIAKDDSDPRGDGIIVPLLSCVRCHVEDGLRPVRNDQRRLLSRGVELYAESPELAQQLAEFYSSPKFDRDLVRDREDYAAAVESATELPPERLAAALAQVYRDYVYELVTPRTAARELGIDINLLPLVLRAADDPVLLALADGLDVQRDQWEASFAQAALLSAAHKSVTSDQKE